MVMGVNFCPNCGQRVKRAANFCPKCGVKLATMIADSKEPLEGVDPEYLLQPDVETLQQKDSDAEDQEDTSEESDSDEAPRWEQTETLFDGDGENFPHLKRRAANEIAQAAKTQQDRTSIPSMGLAAALAAVAGGTVAAAGAAPAESFAAQKEEAVPVMASEPALNPAPQTETAQKKDTTDAADPLVPGPAGAWKESTPENDNPAQDTPLQTKKSADAQSVLPQDNVAEEMSEPDADKASCKSEAPASPELSVDDELAAARAELARAEAELAAVQEQSNASDKIIEAASSNTSAAKAAIGAAVVGAAAASITSAEKNDPQKASDAAGSLPKAKCRDNKELIKLQPVPTGNDSTAVDEENSTPIGSDGEVAAPKKNSAPASADRQGGNKNFIAVIILLAVIAAVAVYWQMNS